MELSVSVQEKVKKIQFDDGMVVKKGDILLELENDVEKMELEQSLINREEAKREFDRTASLFHSNIATQKEFDA